jgi:hypothetical protein
VVAARRARSAPDLSDHRHDLGHLAHATNPTGGGSPTNQPGFHRPGYLLLLRPLPAQADPLNIAVGADAIAYVNRTDAVLEGYQVVVRSRGASAPVAETVTVLPHVDLSGQFDVLQLVLSGEQVMLRTGVQVRPSINATGLEERRWFYWSSIRVFRRKSGSGEPSYELIQSFYESLNKSANEDFSAGFMRVSGKRMAFQVHVHRLVGVSYYTWELFEYNGTASAWAPSAAFEAVGGGSDVGFAGDRVVFVQVLDGRYRIPYLMTLPADCKALSTAETVAIVAVSAFALCVLCAIILYARKGKRAAAAKRTAALAVSPAEL